MATLDSLKLKTAEAMFLQRFPGGFDDPEMQVIAKRHRMDKMITFAQDSFSLSALEDINKSADNMVKIAVSYTHLTLPTKA